MWLHGCDGPKAWLTYARAKLWWRHESTEQTSEQTKRRRKTYSIMNNNDNQKQRKSEKQKSKFRKSENKYINSEKNRKANSEFRKTFQKRAAGRYSRNPGDTARIREIQPKSGRYKIKLYFSNLCVLLFCFSDFRFLICGFSCFQLPTNSAPKCMRPCA